MPEAKEQPGAEFIRIMRGAHIDTDDFRLAEMIWLSRFMIPEEAEAETGADLSGRGEPGAATEEGPPSAGGAGPILGSIEIITRSYREQQAQDVYRFTEADEDGQIPVSPRRITGVPPLPNADALARSLRPFNRRFKTLTAGPVDETATVERAAESDLILPVQGPSTEKWFDAAVVFEDRPTMVVWRETIREFRLLLERHGAFRDARVWRIVFEQSESGSAVEPKLISYSNSRRKIEAIAAPNGRRLVFLVSDGVSKAWRDGEILNVLKAWGSRMPVVLLQVLGDEQWFRTAHGDPEKRVRSPLPGRPNTRLETVPRTLSEKLKPETPEFKLPIVMPYPRSMGRWASMLMSNGDSAPAILLKAPEAPPKSAPASNIDSERRLRSLGTTARELIKYFSAVPLQVPIMRLVQRVMMPDSRIEHLAEIMLSGLIQRENPDSDVSGLREDQIDYDFIDPKVRENLQRELTFGEADYVIRRVSEYIGERIGGRFDLRALLEDYEGPTQKIPKSAWKFATIASQVLASKGVRPKSSRGEIVEGRGNGTVELSPFEFTTVTLDRKGKETNRRALTANQFIEELAPGIGLEMVAVPGGKFSMGTAKRDVDRLIEEYTRYGSSKKDAQSWIGWEQPEHSVSIPDFYIGKITITQKQWEIVAGWEKEKVELDLKPKPSNFKGDDRPVENISWFDAREFCARLAKKTGRVYRLPSESEWEYACRAGTNTPFAFGETITPEIVNYDGNYPYANVEKGKYRNETVPAGSLGVANPFGLFDMYGNVWEWCEDVWHDNYLNAPEDGRAWMEGGDQERRVLRGGSYVSKAWYCRSAYRDRNVARNFYDNVGLRVVASARTK